MKTLVLNGSPKKNKAESNTEMLAQHFIKGMKQPCEILRISEENPAALAEYMKSFDNIIIIFPLYVHAMPGIVMKLFEHMEPTKENGKSIGFIIQQGFEESAQSRYVKPYLAGISKQINYNYLGTVAKGGCAGMVYVPEKMVAKVLQKYTDLGIQFEKTNAFDNEIASELKKPYEFSKAELRKLNFMTKIGVTNIFWHSMLRKNKAMGKRFDRPYL